MVKKPGISIPNFKVFLRKDGKTTVARDEAATLAKLDISARIARKKSKRVRIVKRTVT